MNNNLKLAIVTFHNGFSPNDVGGVSSAPVYLRDQLSSHFESVDLITLRLNKKYNSPITEGIIHVTDITDLDKYDFIIFTTPGLTYEKYDEKTPDKYLDVISHAKKFTIIFNEENDRKLYPYLQNFLSSDSLAFLTFNCPTMNIPFESLLEQCPKYNYVSFSPILPAKDVILEKAKSKIPSIISTCRWTTAKRIYEYLAMSPEFNSHDIAVYSAGSHQSYWYNLRMEELPTDDYTDLGYFEPSQLPEILKDKMFHWNFGFLVRSMGLRNQQPRIEIATMEAFIEGCLPIICEDITPDWVGYDSAIRLPKGRYLELPQILSEMTVTERLDRLDKFYDLVMQNSILHYTEYARLIEESTTL